MIDFIALSGFLGAGKTTTMMAERRQLQSRGRRVAVITNDQGSVLAAACARADISSATRR
jgi:G3E family GTPase